MNLPHFSFYPRDWLVDVAHLSYEERGVFFDLLCHMWVRGEVCSLPDDDKAIAKLLRVTPSKWRKWKIALTESFSPVLFQKNGELFSRRLQKEYQKALDKSGKRSDAAHARWDAEKSNANALDLHEQNEADAPLTRVNTEADTESLTVVKQEQVDSSLNSTLAHSEPPQPEKQDTEFDEFFQQFISNYPRNRDGLIPRKKDAEKQARRLPKRDRPLVLLAEANYRLSQKVIDGYVKEPAGFLKNDYWKDYEQPLDTTAIERRNDNGRQNGQHNQYRTSAEKTADNYRAIANRWATFGVGTDSGADESGERTTPT